VEPKGVAAEVEAEARGVTVEESRPRPAADVAAEWPREGARDAAREGAGTQRRDDGACLQSVAAHQIEAGHWYVPADQEAALVESDAGLRDPRLQLGGQRLFLLVAGVAVVVQEFDQVLRGECPRERGRLDAPEQSQCQESGPQDAAKPRERLHAILPSLFPTVGRGRDERLKVEGILRIAVGRLHGSKGPGLPSPCDRATGKGGPVYGAISAARRENPACGSAHHARHIARYAASSARTNGSGRPSGDCSTLDRSARRTSSSSARRPAQLAAMSTYSFASPARSSGSPIASSRSAPMRAM